MEEITDSSFGVVPLRVTPVGVEVLLIHQVGRRGDTYWTFPKGHQEPNESKTACATRELHEETGVVLEQIFEHISFSTSYRFVHEQQMVNKTVTYFLGLVSEHVKLIPQTGEVAAVGFFIYPEAHTLLTYDASRKILDEAVKAFSNLTS